MMDLKAEDIDEMELEELDATADLLLQQIKQIKTDGNLQDAMASFHTPAEQSADTVAQLLNVNSASKGVLPEKVIQVDDSNDIAGTQPRPAWSTYWRTTADIKSHLFAAIKKNPKDVMNEYVEELCKQTGDNLDEISKHLNAVAAERHAKDILEEMEETDDEEKIFWDKLEENGYAFSVRGVKGNHLAGRWQRWLKANPANKRSYDTLKGHKAKSEFRQ